MSKQTVLVDSIITSMLAIVEKHSLKLMTSPYANDLILHDRAFLKKTASPDAHSAWMVGDMHTHIVALGFEKEQNEMVQCNGPINCDT